MNPANLDRATELLAKATPRPWPPEMSTYYAYRGGDNVRNIETFNADHALMRLAVNSFEAQRECLRRFADFALGVRVNSPDEDLAQWADLLIAQAKELLK